MKSFVEHMKLITESKQDIINLGFPKVMADILFDWFGKHSHLIARWFRHFISYDPNKKNWWNTSRSGMIGEGDRFNTLMQLYDASRSSEDYKKELEELGFETDDHWMYDDPDYLQEERDELKKGIKQELLKDIFFKYDIIKDIFDKKLIDVAPYKNLSFSDAKDKYDEKRIFKEAKPIRVYPDGFKWINVGSHCQLIAKGMNNCGTAMGTDPDRTILVLFNQSNTPHAMVTYHPNKGTISNEEGGSSSALKDKYHPYILDLVKFLNVKFDINHSKSDSLKLKYSLENPNFQNQFMS